MSRLLLLTVFLVSQFYCLAQRRVTIHKEKQPMEALIGDAVAQAGLVWVRGRIIFQDCPPMDVDCNQVTIEEFFHQLFEGLDYKWEITRGTVIISRSYANKGLPYLNLQGKVLDTAHQPLEGAEVRPVGLSRSVLTGKNGTFSLKVKGFLTVVEISCPGYGSRQLELSNKLRHDTGIVLEPKPTKLDEAVSIAYGKTSERLSTGTANSLKAGGIGIQATNNVMGALQGMAPNIFIRRPNGVSGSSYNAVSRGQKSILQGNDLLYIVDGVPMPSVSFVGTIGPGSSLGSGGASTLNGIALTTIRSITVLSGAGATAIYGSRGANGVVLIELLTPDTGRLRITAEVSAGLIQAAKNSPLLNTQQFLDLRSEAVRNDGLPVDTTTVPELKWGRGRYRNYQKLVMGNTVHALNASVGVTGGSEYSSFLVSGNMSKQASVFPDKTEDLRQGLYGYWHGLSKDRKLQLSVSGLYSYQRQLLPLEDLSAYAGLAPNAPDFFGPDGKPVWSSSDLSFSNISALTYNTYRLVVNNLLGHAQLGWKPYSWLSFEGSLGVYRQGSNEKGASTRLGQDAADSGIVNYSDNDYTSKIAEGLVRYSNKVGWGLLEGIVGGSWQQEIRDSFMVNIHYPSDSLLAAGTGGRAGTLSMGQASYDYRSLFGRGQYVIGNRYILTVTGRLDKSSRLAAGRQFGKFYSVGGAWIFTQERFLRGKKVLSYGKLRGNYGITGNDQILSKDASNIRWELNYNTELGLDLAFWKDRLLFSVVGYRSWSDNQVLKVGRGRQAILSNEPVKVSNEGLEFIVRTSVGGNAAGSLKWVSQLNLTLPRNKLAEYAQLESSAYATTLVVGQSLSVSRAYHFLGVDPKTGLYTFKDVDGDGELTYKDFLVSRSKDPRCYGGWSNTFIYGPWQLDIIGVFCFQNGDNPLTALGLRNMPGAEGFFQLSNGPVEWNDHWRKPGDRTRLQRLTAGQDQDALTAFGNYLSSDANIIDASYFRLKTVSLSWRFPKQQLKKWHLVSGQLYLRAQDCWTVSRYGVTDPETQNPLVLPPVRQWQAGCKLSL